MCVELVGDSMAIKCNRRLGYVEVPVDTKWSRRAGDRRFAAAMTLERVVRISTVPLCSGIYTGVEVDETCEVDVAVECNRRSTDIGE